MDKFNIENAITLDELKENAKLISIEEYYLKYCNVSEIDLNNKELRIFENGTLLDKEFEDGIYRIYSGKKFIGIGIIRNKKLKRDILI